MVFTVLLDDVVVAKVTIKNVLAPLFTVVVDDVASDVGDVDVVRWRIRKRSSSLIASIKVLAVMRLEGIGVHVGVFAFLSSLLTPDHPFAACIPNQQPEARSPIPLG